MLHDDPALLSSIAQSLLDVDTCFGVTTFLEKNPGIRVQIGIVIGFCLYRAVTHFFRLVKILFLYRKIVSIIVQCTDVVGIINQR